MPNTEASGGLSSPSIYIKKRILIVYMHHRIHNSIVKEPIHTIYTSNIPSTFRLTWEPYAGILHVGRLTLLCPSSSGMHHAAGASLPPPVSPLPRRPPRFCASALFPPALCVKALSSSSSFGDVLFFVGSRPYQSRWVPQSGWDWASPPCACLSPGEGWCRLTADKVILTSSSAVGARVCLNGLQRGC